MVTPIAADWKISRVLSEYPQLLETIIGLSPAFERLRNPLMRKVQTRLVTVAQAARVAGMDPEEMLVALNRAIGAVYVPSTSSAPKQSAQSLSDTDLPADPFHTEIDVREIIARGEQPFTPVMRAAKLVPMGETLHLIVDFEPVPLYAELAKLGFTHQTRRQRDTWHVYATRVSQANSSAASPSPASAGGVGEMPASAEVTIDISELVPPEPMMKVLAALHELPAGGVLTVNHVRRPIHLYDRLNELGYPHETTEPAPDQVRIVIRKPGTPE